MRKSKNLDFLKNQPNIILSDAAKSLKVGGMELKPAGVEQRLTVAKATTHKASPIPQRAKFIKKFNKVGGVGKDKKKISVERKEQSTLPAEREVGDETKDGGREEVIETVTDSIASSPVREMKV